MSNFSEIEKQENSRRSFIKTASALAGLCLLNCDLAGQEPVSIPYERALYDENIIREKVKFRSGNGEIEGFLSRPKKKGHYPIVIVVSGSTFDDEYIQNMTAKFAQANFVSISPNIFSLQQDGMTPEEKRKVFAEQITDENIFQDLTAAIDYLKQQKYVKKKKIGITGFCFGGRCALMFAAHDKDVDAVVPFYGNLTTPEFANRKQNPVDVVNQIKVPVQGHYSANDNEIPLDQLKKFEAELKNQGTQVQMFTYNAPHGFFASNRKSYNAEAAQLSWQRTIDFFNKILNR
jgi:carboxymethylenebutenolidase